MTNIGFAGSSSSQRRRRMNFKICPPKIVSLEQERRLGNRGSSVGEAVTYIKRGWMTAPTEPLESGFARSIMFLVEDVGRHIRRFGKLFDHLRPTGKTFQPGPFALPTEWASR